MNLRFCQSLFVATCFIGATSAAPIVPGERHLKDNIARGELLLGELNCIACHKTDDKRIVAKSAPLLATIGSRLDAANITKLASNPHAFRPGTTMPRLKHSDQKLANITAYLSSLKRNRALPQYPNGDSDRGRSLYHSIGCVACHAPQPGLRPRGVDDFIEITPPTSPSVPITIAKIYPRAELTAFLLNPLAIRPSGRMPHMKLTAAEAADLTTYLQPNSPTIKEARVASLGRREFESIGCAACHDTGDGLQAMKAKPLAQIKAADCRVADYGLDDQQKLSIRAALASSNRRPTATQRVHQTLARLNCYACHERNGIGGLEEMRAIHFQPRDAAGKSLGDEGRIPPPLTHAGWKLTKNWMRQILTGAKGSEIRPHLVARMPMFGENNVTPLFDDFANADPPNPIITIDISGAQKHHRGFLGRHLIGNKGLNCITCHGLQGKKPTGANFMDLTQTTKRLNPTWFMAFLLDPQTIRPRTMMPTFFKDGKSPLSTMKAGKDARMQIEQMWIYLREADHAHLPDGFSTESFVLKPTNKPIVFRTFMEHAGTQAIAVGFPQGIHAAFDAKNVRWAIVWRGAFLDAESTWQDRFTPLARPLGTDVKVLPKHQAFKPEEEKADWQFRGYRLDKSGVPTFQYSIHGIHFEDRLEPSRDGQSFERTVRATVDTKQLTIHGLTGKPKTVTARDDVVVVKETVAW